jgi:hypothetical protein
MKSRVQFMSVRVGLLARYLLLRKGVVGYLFLPRRRARGVGRSRYMLGTVCTVIVHSRL